MRELRHAEAGRSQVGRPARRDSSRISALVSPASASGAGPLAVQRVLVDAVDDVLVTALAADGFEAGEELVLAVEAAVRIVGHVFGVVELAGPLLPLQGRA